MRTSTRVTLAGVLALLASGLVVLLTTPQGGTPARPGSVPVIEAAAAFETGSESRPLARGAVAPIRPVPFSEREEPASNPSDATPNDADQIVVTGDVLDCDGAPATTVGVSILRLQDGMPVGSPCARGETDGQGRFQLTVPRPAPAECVLVAFKPARRPATVPLSFAGAESRNNVRLTFGLGLAVEGVITLDGRPVSGARVSAALKSGADGSLLRWNGGAFETERAAAYCDENGRFILTGLASEIYLIETDQLLPETSMGLICQAEVLPPARGVQLGVQSGRLRIRVLGRGELLPQARVAILDSRGERMSIPETPELRVASGLPFTIEAAQRGFVPKQVAVPALTAGENRDLDVTLDADGSPDLHLKLRGASEINLASVSVQLIPMSVPHEEGVCVQKELRRGLRAERGQDDEFLLEHIPYPAGNYMLLLLPEPPVSWFLPIQTELVLPARGSLELALDVVRGGRVDVRILGADFSPLQGDWVLRDAAGALVLTAAAGGFVRPDGHDGRAEADRLTRSTRMISPGTYEIEVRSEGFRTDRQPVTISAGSTTTKTFRLEAETH